MMSRPGNPAGPGNLAVFWILSLKLSSAQEIELARQLSCRRQELSHSRYVIKFLQRGQYHLAIRTVE
jgi:hypothetical protein